MGARFLYPRLNCRLQLDSSHTLTQSEVDTLDASTIQEINKIIYIHDACGIHVLLGELLRYMYIHKQ